MAERWHCSLETLANVASCLSAVPQPAKFIAADCGISLVHAYRALRELIERFGVRIERTHGGFAVKDRRSRRILRRLCRRCGSW